MPKFRIPTSFSIEQELIEKIDAKATRLGISKSALIRAIVLKYFCPNQKKGVEDV